MRHWLLILLVSLMNNFLSISLSAGSCYLGVKTSGDSNPALVSEISSSLVSQYFKEVQPIPSSGIIDDTTFITTKIVLKVKNERNVRVLLVDLGTNFSNEYTSLIKGFYGKY